MAICDRCQQDREPSPISFGGPICEPCLRTTYAEMQLDSRFRDHPTFLALSAFFGKGRRAKCVTCGRELVEGKDEAHTMTSGGRVDVICTPCWHTVTQHVNETDLEQN